MNHTNQIHFQALTMADLSLLHTWLLSNVVKQWYGKQEYTYQDIVEKYAPRISGHEPTRSFLIRYSSFPIGYIQTYRIIDYPEYNLYVQANEHAAGVDLFIGEDDYRQKGLGRIIIRKFLQEIVFAPPHITHCLIGPEPKNARAIRCYEHVGFCYLKTIQVPDEPEPEYLMHIQRDALLLNDT